MNRLSQCLLGTTMAFVFFTLPSYADLYDVPKVVAVQNRSYLLSDEVTLQAGYLPLDAFIKYFSFGLVFTHYFSDFLGWEVFNANYAAANPSGLERDLINNFQVTPDKFDTLDYFGSTNLV